MLENNPITPYIILGFGAILILCQVFALVMLIVNEIKKKPETQKTGEEK